jgi:hypothetical protein
MLTMTMPFDRQLKTQPSPHETGIVDVLVLALLPLNSIKDLISLLN